MTDTTSIQLSPTDEAFIARTFAARRSEFGGFFMETDEDESNEDNSNEGESNEDESNNDESNDGNSNEDESGEDESNEDNSNDESGEDGDEDESGNEREPLSQEDANAALRKVRRSEAKTRTRLRDLEAKLSEAKSQDEVDELITESKKESSAEARELLVENVALSHGLPKDLAETLGKYNATTREELNAHAEVLARYVSGEIDPDDVSGGLDPNGSNGAFDPVAASRKNRKRRYF